MRSPLLVATILCLAAAPAWAQQAQPAGLVKVASGSAYVVRAGVEQPARIGQPIFETDSLKTGPDGSIGVTLKDDTRVSIGPASEVRLDQFQYTAAAGPYALAIKFVRGVAAYVSGRIAKLSPDRVKLEAPAAIVGVRGTTLAIRVTE